MLPHKKCYCCGLEMSELIWLWFCVLLWITALILWIWTRSTIIIINETVITIQYWVCSHKYLLLILCTWCSVTSNNNMHCNCVRTLIFKMETKKIQTLWIYIVFFIKCIVSYRSIKFRNIDHSGKKQQRCSIVSQTMLPLLHWP